MRGSLSPPVFLPFCSFIIKFIDIIEREVSYYAIARNQAMDLEANIR
jgi:hypothetical protein